MRRPPAQPWRAQGWPPHRTRPRRGHPAAGGPRREWCPPHQRAAEPTSTSQAEPRPASAATGARSAGRRGSSACRRAVARGPHQPQKTAPPRTRRHRQSAADSQSVRVRTRRVTLGAPALTCLAVRKGGSLDPVAAPLTRTRRPRPQPAAQRQRAGAATALDGIARERRRAGEPLSLSTAAGWLPLCAHSQAFPLCAASQAPASRAGAALPRTYSRARAGVQTYTHFQKK